MKFARKQLQNSSQKSNESTAAATAALASTVEQAQPPITSMVIRLAELKLLLGVSAASIWRWIKAGTFPKPIHLSPHGKASTRGHACGWLRVDIDHWLAERRRERDERAS